jgi:hypothetical protein
VTLIDLLTAIAFVSPIVGGVMAGWRVSVVGAAVGFFMGAFIAIGGIWILRRVASRVAASNQTKVTAFLLALVYAAIFAWAFLGLALADSATTAIMSRFRI